MAQVTIATGPDVAYYTDQTGAGYYLLDEEPPGRWVGKAAPGLDLVGDVNADVMKNLYHYNVAPDGSLLGLSQKDPRYQGRKLWETIQAAIDKRVEELGPLATPAKVRHIRLSERAKARRKTPFYDMTFSSEKSVSIAWAAARATALKAREEAAEQNGEQTRAAARTGAEQNEAPDGGLLVTAARYEALARSVEQATLAGSDAMFAYTEERGAGVRTGHHSKVTGEWRDAAGFVAARFLQHTSRSNDPQLHVQTVILNKAQRADGADTRWRSLDGAQLWALRLGAAAYASVAEAQHLARLGLPLVKREDGNGYEIGGVSQATIDAFSQRTKQVEAEIAEAIAEYEAMFGGIDRGSLYRLRKRAAVKTRSVKQRPSTARKGASKSEAQAAAVKLEQWIDRAEAENAQALTEIWDAIWAYLAEHPEAAPEQMPSESEREEMIRAAISEVQRQNASWSRPALEWELFRQLAVLPAKADWAQYLTGLTDDALDNRVTDSAVLQIGHVPDVVDTAPLGLRKDGTSILRKPHEARYTTAEHLNREEWILAECKRPVPQLVAEETAQAAVADTDLDISQRRAAIGLLASTTLVTSLIAPAGTGKTHVMGPVSRTWVAETGCRMIGLTLSQNAATVMAGEGMTEAWNIARFFKRHVPVYRNDVLVVDEASQVSTVDLMRIMNLAKDRGARVILVGDPEQLGPVEAGGMYGMVADASVSYELDEVHRFEERWEAEASIRLRAGDMTVWEEYDSRGMVQHGPANRMMDDAAARWLDHHYYGRNALLLAATNEQARELSAMVRQLRIEGGEIGSADEITLSDGNAAGTGDYVRARLNSKIRISDGRMLENRDTIRIDGWLNVNNGREAVAVLRDPGAPGGWSGRFTIPEEYLRENAELDYSGNIHVAQGRTVDVVCLVAGEGTTRRGLYVGTSRGRIENEIFVVTGPADPNDWTRQEREAWKEARLIEAMELKKGGADEKTYHAVMGAKMPEPEGLREQLPWEAVIAAAMERDDMPPTATETMRQAQYLPRHAGHLLNIAEQYWWKDIAPQVDELIKARIPADDYRRYLKDPARPALLEALREHEIGGRPIPELVEAITVRELDGLNSIAAGLHGRLGKEEAPERGHTTTWSERFPSTWARQPEALREDLETADAHQRELGEQLAEQPPHWALEAWGAPSQEPGALRDDWIKNAGIVGSYREAAGISDPNVAIGHAPSLQPGLREGFSAAVRALQLPDEAALYKAMGRGDLEAQVRQYERAEATAPADVQAEMDANRNLIRDAEHRAHLAREAGRLDLAREAEAESTGLVGDRVGLRAADAARKDWEEVHADQTRAAEQAQAELKTRRVPRPSPAAVLQDDEPLPEHVDPGRYAEQKAAQAARVQADREARRRASAEEWLDIDPELARRTYPDLVPQIEAERAERGEEEGAPAERTQRALDTIRAATETVARTADELEVQAEEDRRQRTQYREAAPDVEAEYEQHHRHYRPGPDRDGPSLGR